MTTEQRIEALAHVCGCAGKTPLDGVVLPARERMRPRLRAAGVSLPDLPDVTLLPNTSTLRRTTDQCTLDGKPGAVEPTDAPATWTLAATFADRALGRDAETFAARVGDAYAALGRAGAHVVLGKGHAVQLEGATAPIQWFEHLVPAGDRRPGYRVANVDVVHAFPKLDPVRQARIATVHALNDCYAAGGTENREVRPLVAAPADATPEPGTVREWYREATDATVHPAAVLGHDGDGWLFGATATATTPRRPAIRVDALEPGYAVLLRRPFGALACYSHAVEAGDDDLHQRALDSLTDDHRPIARALAQFRPTGDESFDPARHVAVVTDVSGPGVRGLADLVARADHRLHLTDLPLLDRAALASARRAWTVPDVTVETNGPLAVVARPAVLDAIADRLGTVDGCDPAIVGEVRPADDRHLSVAPDQPLAEYAEWAIRRGEPS
jgi:selenophosphate synthase